MNFTELVNEVLIIVKRPDLTDRIQSAVRAATQKMHHSDFYYKDLKEIAVQFENELFIQNFLPTEVISNFRKAKYIRRWNGDISGNVGEFFTHIQIENSNDSYGYIKENVFYMAGQMLQVRASPAVFRVLFGAYVHPVVTPESSYDSWIAREYPFAIIHEAARTVFMSISLEEQANAQARLAGEILAEIKASNIDDMPMT